MNDPRQKNPPAGPGHDHMQRGRRIVRNGFFPAAAFLLSVQGAPCVSAGAYSAPDEWRPAWTAFDFDHPEQLAAWALREHTKARLVPSPWNGRWTAMELVFEPRSDDRRHWPAAICRGKNLRLPPQPELYRYLLMRVKNTGNAPAYFFLHFRNQHGGRFSTPHAPRTWTLEPGEETAIAYPLADLVNAMPLDGIQEFHIVTDTPKQVFRLVFDDIRFSPGLLPQIESALTALRRVRRIVAWNVAKGEFHRRTTDRLFEIDAALAGLRREIRAAVRQDVSPEQISRWERRIDRLRADIERTTNAIRTEPGKERARTAIRLLGIRDDWILGVESSMVKVAWDALPFLGRFAAPLYLDGARGETVHGQVVIVPTGTDLKQVTWRAPPLVGPSGARLPVRVRVVGFLRTARPGSYEVPYVGWWPDPLLDHLHTFDVPSFAQQPLWITVDIPRDAKPGEYRGKLAVAATGRNPQSVSIRLRVRSFALPVEHHFKLAVNYEEREVARISGKRWNDSLKWRYREFLLKHRFNVDSIYQILPMWDESVEDLKRLKAGGQNFITAAVFNNTNAPGWRDHVLKFMQRARAAGVEDICWFYGFDESPAGLRKDILYHARACHELWPHARVMTTATTELMRDPEVRKVIDAWVPTTDVYERIGDEIERVRREGRQVWYYVCVGPKHPYANFFIEYPAVEQRLLTGFMAWKSRTDGFLYYSLNRAPKNDKPISDGPLCTWNPASYDDYNGDGCLFYCGADGPVSTVRFENLRDGIEDYEALWLLRDLLQRAERAPRAKPRAAVLSRARQALAVPDDVVRTLSDYTLDPDRVRAYRQRVYDAVEALMSGR